MLRFKDLNCAFTARINIAWNCWLGQKHGNYLKESCIMEIEWTYRKKWFISSFYCWSPLCILFYILLSSNTLKNAYLFPQYEEWEKHNLNLERKKLYENFFLCAKKKKMGRLEECNTVFCSLTVIFFIFFFSPAAQVYTKSSDCRYKSASAVCLTAFFIHVIVLGFDMLTPLHFSILLKLMNIRDYFPIPSHVSRKKNWYSTST